nr:MAG TPA: hypothetical protein [Caudoviricetes sp.]DAZ19806.1 MAG TPA: hypothetical protein [Caudoviricetes sp.]
MAESLEQRWEVYEIIDFSLLFLDSRVLRPL